MVTEVITGITVCGQEVWEKKLFALAGAVCSNRAGDGCSGKFLTYQSETSEIGKPEHKAEVTI